MTTYKTVTAQEAVKVIKSGDGVYLHSVASTPHILINAMVERGRAGELRNVSIYSSITTGVASYTAPEFEGIFQMNSLFVGANVRKATQDGFADYIPVFLSETQKIIRERYIKINVAMVQISPPDRHGYVSLGTSVDCSLAAVETADTVVAIINKNVPRAWGDAMLHISNFDILVENDSPLAEAPAEPTNELDLAIGKHIADLIEDGATLQMGIGAIPNAVLDMLGNHKRLGIHTEMFSDGLLPLIEKGVVTGEEKKIDKRKIVACFLMGSKKVYDFVDDNPGVLMMDVAYTNDINIIRQNPKVIAINAALQIDLTGQVCADSLGTKFYSGVGGQVDFVRGASFSPGGKSIIAMHSVTPKGESKIAPILLPGAGVVSSRPIVHYLVTEQGAINLYGKTLQERAKLITSIAAPQHRESLDRAAFERFGKHFHYVG